MDQELQELGCHNEAGCCLAPPHPDIRRRIRAEQRRLRNNPGATPDADLAPLLRDPVRLGAPTGTMAGVNDGVLISDDAEAAAFPQGFPRTALARARASPLRGDIRTAIVLVDFPDKPMAQGAAQHISDIFFPTGVPGKTSVNDYYSTVSGGKVSFSGEVFGPYRMPNTLVEYANGDHGMDYRKKPNVWTLARDTAAALRSHNINLDGFDNGGNGLVDAFLVVHAGKGAESVWPLNVNLLWSLQTTLTPMEKIGNVKVSGFLTIPEDAVVGLACHELGHLVFGWPDLYDGLPPETAGLGNWCLMAGGSWNGGGLNPCEPSAWCKAVQGWVEVKNETENGSITIEDVKTSREIRRLWKDGDAAGKEYFLVENRQKVGLDSDLPGQGLLVWHVDDGQVDNKDHTHYRIALEQADGLNELGDPQVTDDRGDRGDPFPGRSHNKSFTPNSNPNSHAYTGEDTHVSITNISRPGPEMNMNVAVH